MQLVNGYLCHDRDEVANARRGIDPARPKDGPYGIYRLEPSSDAASGRGPAYTLGGGIGAQQVSPSHVVTPAAYVPGAALDVLA